MVVVCFSFRLIHDSRPCLLALITYELRGEARAAQPEVVWAALTIIIIIIIIIITNC